MTDDRLSDSEPCYVISIAARLVSLHPQTLRYYDRIGLISPERTSGRIRLYSPNDIERLRKIARLTEELGANLAGVEVILNMSERMEELQRRFERMQHQAEQQIQALRQRIRELEALCQSDPQEYQIINVSARDVSSTMSEEEQE